MWRLLACWCTRSSAPPQTCMWSAAVYLALAMLFESQSRPSYRPSPDVAHVLWMYLCSHTTVPQGATSRQSVRRHRDTSYVSQQPQPSCCWRRGERQPAWAPPPLVLAGSSQVHSEAHALHSRLPPAEHLHLPPSWLLRLPSSSPLACRRMAGNQA